MMCAICHETISRETSYTLPECSHSFHTNCLMTWFRKGHDTCPLCQNHGINADMQKPYLLKQTALEQYKTIRRKSRSKNCPKAIKTKIKSLKKAEERLKALKNQKKVFFSSVQPEVPVKKIIQRARRMETKIWNQERLLRKKKICIGLSHEVLIIPIKRQV